MLIRGIMMAMVLAGCVPVAQPVVDPVPVVDPMPQQGTCGAEALQDLVGQSSDKLKLMRFAGPIRVIMPGMMVTMDYQANRVNIQVGPDGLITRVFCG